MTQESKEANEQDIVEMVPERADGAEAGRSVKGQAGPGKRHVPPTQPAIGKPFAIKPPTSYAPPPIALEDGEELLEYKKPRAFAYAPLLFGTLFGAVLLLLFLASGNPAGMIFGFVIFGGLFYVLRYRYYVRVGYWFTSGRIIVDDGTRIQMVPYDEIARSSLAFEQDTVLFTTVYHKEFILRGVGDAESIVRFLSRKGREVKGSA